MTSEKKLLLCHIYPHNTGILHDPSTNQSHRNVYEAVSPPNTTNLHLLPTPCPPQPHRILQALRRYVRAENKDRQHTIRHYQHVLAVDPEKAAQMKSQVSN